MKLVVALIAVIAITIATSCSGSDFEPKMTSAKQDALDETIPITPKKQEATTDRETDALVESVAGLAKNTSELSESVAGLAKSIAGLSSAFRAGMAAESLIPDDDSYSLYDLHLDELASSCNRFDSVSLADYFIDYEEGSAVDVSSTGLALNASSGIPVLVGDGSWDKLPPTCNLDADLFCESAGLYLVLTKNMNLVESYTGCVDLLTKVSESHPLSNCQDVWNDLIPKITEKEPPLEDYLSLVQRQVCKTDKEHFCKRLFAGSEATYLGMFIDKDMTEQIMTMKPPTTAGFCSTE